MRIPENLLPLAVALACAAVASGCAEHGIIPPPLQLPPPASQASAAGSAGQQQEGLQVKELPAPPAVAPSKGSAARKAADAQQATAVAASGGEPAVVNLDQVPLPTFIQVVYSEVLKRNVSLDPAVQSRKDLVTFRTGGTQTQAQLAESVQILLKSYGLSVIDAGGLVRVVPDNAKLGNLPELRRGAADPDVPLPLRPVFQLVQLQAVRQTDVLSWLKTMFGDRVTLHEDASRNAVGISGTPDNVKAALEAIRVLDQPVMAGRKSLTLTPSYWSADDLARRMAEMLSAEGYAVAPVGQPLSGVRYPVVLLPVVALNSVFVFAQSDDILAHATALARTLDRPNDRGIGKNFFTYQVKHKDAAALARTLEQLLTRSSAARSARAAAAPAAAAGSAGGSASSSTAAASTSGASGVVVDESSNTLIFQVDPDEYSQISTLLQTLDRPAKGALIEVTVAELSLDDNSQLGVEWLLTDHRNDGRTVTASTLGGLIKNTGGLNVTVTNSLGAIQAKLNALATDNRASILSSPRVQARNGETATIQVGQEVPIITGQLSNGTTSTSGSTTSTALLQTIQYRSTGVILRVKPVIHSGDQIDLDVQQEVSAAVSTDTGVNNSPTISTRKLDTKLTLSNGSTVVMGGLISDESTKGASGIPFLKDIPVVGGLFSNQTRTGTRRELIVLITPYIINDNEDAVAITDSFRKMLGPWAGNVGTSVPLLAPASPSTSHGELPPDASGAPPLVANPLPAPPAAAPVRPAASAPAARASAPSAAPAASAASAAR